MRIKNLPKGDAPFFDSNQPQAAFLPAGNVSTVPGRSPACQSVFATVHSCRPREGVRLQISFGCPIANRLFCPILSGTAPSCLQNPRGAGREAPPAAVFRPDIRWRTQILRTPPSGCCGGCSLILTLRIEPPLAFYSSTTSWVSRL
jgi:hypothetical protein